MHTFLTHIFEEFGGDGACLCCTVELDGIAVVVDDESSLIVIFHEPSWLVEAAAHVISKHTQMRLSVM